MRPRLFEDPKLLVTRAGDLSLSGQALLELMRAVLARGVPFRFRARGWSMTPFIRDGDVITVSPLLHTSASLGEVVAFVHPATGGLLVHRVVDRRGTSFVIQGDSAPEEADWAIRGESLIGRVTRVERNGRNVWLGLGPERYVIAWLSHAGWLIPMRNWLASWLRPLLRSR